MNDFGSWALAPIDWSYWSVALRWITFGGLIGFVAGALAVAHHHSRFRNLPQ